RLPARVVDIMRAILNLLPIAGLFVLACTQAPTPASPPSEPAPTATNTAPPTSTPQPSKEGPEGAMCGGIAGFGCAPELYCHFALDAHCGAADQTGTCKAKPEMC